MKNDKDLVKRTELLTCMWITLSGKRIENLDNVEI